MYSRIYRPMRRYLRRGGAEIHRNQLELERTQWLPKTELRAMQFEKVQRLLRYAYQHVPFYRERYQSEDIHPDDIKSWKDFQNIPILTKEDVSEHLKSLVSEEPGIEKSENHTGGSTGLPLRFYMDRSFGWWTAALGNRGRSWYGVYPGDKIAWVWGAERDVANHSLRDRLKARVRRHRLLHAFTMTEANMQAFAEMLVDWQPAMIRAYPSTLSVFAQFIKQKGINSIAPRFIEVTSEVLFPAQRELFEEVFQCSVANIYSARELYKIAYDCPDGRLHVSETHYLELVANGQASEAGQMGEIIVTSLHQFAMPLIRYRIGDLGVHDPEDCPCGRGMPILRELVGKTNDVMVTADGMLVSHQYVNAIMKARTEVDHYQFYQPDIHHLEVRLICNQRVDEAWLDTLRREVQSHFGSGTQVSIHLVDHLELTPAGKWRYIISDVEHDLKV